MFLYLGSIKSDLKIGNHGPGAKAASHNVVCYIITKAGSLIGISVPVFSHDNFDISIFSLFVSFARIFYVWRLQISIYISQCNWVCLSAVQVYDLQKFKYCSKLLEEHSWQCLVLYRWCCDPDPYMRGQQ